MFIDDAGARGNSTEAAGNKGNGTSSNRSDGTDQDNRGAQTNTPTDTSHSTTSPNHPESNAHPKSPAWRDGFGSLNAMPHLSTTAQGDLSADFTPDMIEHLVNRIKAVEAKVQTHVPTGSDSEAYFETLNDVGTAWDVLCSIGRRALVLNASANTIPTTPDATAIVAAITEMAAFRRSWPNVYPHECGRERLVEAQRVYSTELAPVYSIELPRRIHMIAPRPERIRSEGRLFDAKLAEASAFLDFAAVAMVAQCLSGRESEAVALLERVSVTCFSLVPTRMVEAMLAIRMRRTMLQVMVGLLEAGLVAPKSLDSVEAKLRGLPLTLEHVAIGETLDGLAAIVRDRTIERSVRRWATGPDAHMGPGLLIEALDTLEKQVAALDRKSAAGSLYRKPLMRLTVYKASDAMAAQPELGSIVLAMLDEAVLFGALAVERPDPKAKWPEVVPELMENSSSTYRNWISFGTEVEDTRAKRVSQNLESLAPTLRELGWIGFDYAYTNSGFSSERFDAESKEYRIEEGLWQDAVVRRSSVFGSVLEDHKSRTVVAVLPFEGVQRLADLYGSEDEVNESNASAHVQWRHLGSTEWHTVFKRRRVQAPDSEAFDPSKPSPEVVDGVVKGEMSPFVTPDKGESPSDGEPEHQAPTAAPHDLVVVSIPWAGTHEYLVAITLVKARRAEFKPDGTIK